VSNTAQRTAQATGAMGARRVERIQSVWSGYGELARYALAGGEAETGVVKDVRPDGGSGRSHERKLRSYDVEATWYREWVGDLPPECPAARAYLAERVEGGWLFVLEDLDAAGFSARVRSPGGAHQRACLEWLAAFHAHHLGRDPQGLWPLGTYWHLDTRPDELEAMEPGPLRDAAERIDARLRGAAVRTIVHGDAKPANFCSRPDGERVAAVDFQYVGGGPGVKDVAYFLQGSGAHEAGLEVYFAALRAALPGHIDAGALEREWRARYPFAVADFSRFLAGWAPSWRAASGGAARSKQTDDACGPSVSGAGAQRRRMSSGRGGPQDQMARQARFVDPKAGLSISLPFLAVGNPRALPVQEGWTCPARRVRLAPGSHSFRGFDMARVWHFLPLAAMAVLWSLLQVGHYLGFKLEVDVFVANFSAEQVAFFAAAPLWISIARGLGVWAGVIGAVMLANRQATGFFFSFSFIGWAVATVGWIWFATPTMEDAFGTLGRDLLIASTIVAFCFAVYARWMHVRWRYGRDPYLD